MKKHIKNKLKQEKKNIMKHIKKKEKNILKKMQKKLKHIKGKKWYVNVVAQFQEIIYHYIEKTKYIQNRL